MRTRSRFAAIAAIVVSVVLLVALAMALGAVFLAGPAHAAPGSMVWKKRPSPSVTMDWLEVCSRGPDGSVYAAGHAGSSPNGDIWVTKYTAAGALAWSALWSGTAGLYDSSRDLAVDGAGNVYVCGYTMAATNRRDSVILKYSASGRLRWATVYPCSAADDEADAIGLDDAGNVYVAGSADTPTDTLAIYTARFSKGTGALAWSSPYLGAGVGYATGIVVTRGGTCYTSGYSGADWSSRDAVLIKTSPEGVQAWAKAWAGPAGLSDWWGGVELVRGGVIVAGTTGDGGPSDLAVARYGSAGSRKWVRTWSSKGSRSDRDGDLSVGADGSIWLCGTVAIAEGDSRAALVKWSSSGKRLFARTMGTSASPAAFYGLTVDGSGNAYAAGGVRRTPGGWDGLAVKYGPTGLRRWVSSAGYGPDSNDEFYDTCLGPKGCVYACGETDWDAADTTGLLVKFRR